MVGALGRQAGTGWAQPWACLGPVRGALRALTEQRYTNHPEKQQEAGVLAAALG